MQPREFIFRLSLCPGLGPLSRVRLWRVAEQNYCFDNLELTHQPVADYTTGQGKLAKKLGEPLFGPVG